MLVKIWHALTGQILLEADIPEDPSPIHGLRGMMDDSAPDHFDLLVGTEIISRGKTIAEVIHAAGVGDDQTLYLQMLPRIRLIVKCDCVKFRDARIQRSKEGRNYWGSLFMFLNDNDRFGRTGLAQRAVLEATEEDHQAVIEFDELAPYDRMHFEVDIIEKVKDVVRTEFGHALSLGTIRLETASLKTSLSTGTGLVMKPLVFGEMVPFRIVQT